MSTLWNLSLLLCLIGSALPVCAGESETRTGREDSTPRNSSHWAFQPLKRIEPPPAVDGGSHHPIDRFVARARQARGLTPVTRAESYVLLRRVFFDLIGLPPSREEIEQFEAQSAQAPVAAFEQVIDRLLASPHYGERWGRHWMDVVRYADTAGDNADYPIPEAQRYRDYIIDAFQRDMPFDQFIHEQLAGDVIAQQRPTDRYADLITATGFLALSRRYGTAPYELWHLTLEDTIETVGRAFMGLTLRCARCHDHKFDPVTTADYYALYGIFDSTQFPWAGGEEFQSKSYPRRNFVPLVPDEEAGEPLTLYQAQLEATQARIAQLEEQSEGADEQKNPELKRQLAALKLDFRQLAGPGLPVNLPGAYAVRDGKPHDVPIQLSGDPSQPGDIIPRGAIAILSQEPLEIPPSQSGRLQLAEWITSPAHPLTARVMVNRVWQQHFGHSIVSTPSNFGTNGTPPTHPELLDYLARRFVESGWSVKELHRLILTSQTWQLASETDHNNARVDTGNAYYWRHDRRRLDAEAIRDTMLFVSQRLDLTRPDPHPFPPIGDWHWTQHNQFTDRYETAHRSVYLMTQRLQKHPFLALFDGPDTNTTTGKRTTATVTPQSLYLMNSPDMARFASAFAKRLISKAESAAARIHFAFWLCFGRPPGDDELIRDETYVESVLAALARERPNLTDSEHEAWLSYARILLSTNEFFYLD